MRLSVLDLLGVHAGQSTAQALRASRALAAEADRLGYTRYWVAEHHNMPTAAATVPAVIIPYLAAGTERLRFGSGGVMLPNHAPLAIAEQFALLESMFPDRIDLGLGRAPGADGVTAFLLRGQRAAGAESFPQDVELLTQLLGLGENDEDTLQVMLGERPFSLRATPRLVSAPDVWLLGSSGYSAALAAQRGLPFVFANHFGAPGVEEALATYRSQYQPSAAHPEPRTLLPVNVLVHPDVAEAERSVQPQLIMMTRLQANAPLVPMLTIEEAARYDWSAREREIAQGTRSTWYVGAPEIVAGQLRELADRLQVDELMVWPIAGHSERDRPDAAGGRGVTLEILAEQLLS